MKIRKKHFSIVAFALALGTPCYADISETVAGGSSGTYGSSSGIAFNADGSKLYAASTADAKITILDPNTGDLIKQFTAANGLLGPDDVVITSGGDLYYSDTLGGFVGKITDVNNAPANVQVVRLPSTVTGFPILPLGLVNGIALSEDELHLYAGVCSRPPDFPGGPNANRLFHFDLSQNPVTVNVVTDANGQPLDLGYGCSLNGMTYKNGYLYGAQAFEGAIYRVGPMNQPTPPQAYVVVAGTGPHSELQCPGASPDLTSPASVKFDAQGRLFIADSYNNRLRRVDNPNGVCQTAKNVANLPSTSGAGSIAIKDDTIYVSSSSDGYIVPVSSNGDVGDFIKTPGLVLPLGVAAVGQKVYVADYIGFRTIDPNEFGIQKTSYQTFADYMGDSTDLLHPNPTGITGPFNVAKFGNHVVISDFLDHSIQIWNQFNKTGIAFINTRDFDSVVPGPGLLQLGRPITVIEYQGPNDSVPSIVSGQFRSAALTSFLVKYQGPDYAAPPVTLGSAYPGLLFTGLATTDNGSQSQYWVAGYNPLVPTSGAIYVFDHTGIQVVGGNKVTVATGLIRPQGIAYYNNHLYVIELGFPAANIPAALSSIDLSTGVKKVIESPIPVGVSNPAVGASLIAGVTVDAATGDLYYTGAATRVLNRILRSDVAAIENA